MDTDRSGRTLKAYRDLFWKAEKRIKELEASLKAGGEVSERQYQTIKELEARVEIAEFNQNELRNMYKRAKPLVTELAAIFRGELDKAIGEQG